MNGVNMCVHFFMFPERKLRFETRVVVADDADQIRNCDKNTTRNNKLKLFV